MQFVLGISDPYLIVRLRNVSFTIILKNSYQISLAPPHHRFLTHLTSIFIGHFQVPFILEFKQASFLHSVLDILKNWIYHEIKSNIVRGVVA